MIPGSGNGDFYCEDSLSALNFTIATDVLAWFALSFTFGPVNRLGKVESPIQLAGPVFSPIGRT